MDFGIPAATSLNDKNAASRWSIIFLGQHTRRWRVVQVVVFFQPEQVETRFVALDQRVVVVIPEPLRLDPLAIDEVL